MNVKPTPEEIAAMVFERECAERYHEHVRQAQMKSERDVEQEEMLR